MKNLKELGIIAFMMLSSIACKNSSQSRQIDNELKSYDLIEETNDWSSDSKALKLVMNNGKIGFLYGNGEELFPCIFDSIVDVENYEYKTVNGKYMQTKKGYFTPFAKVKQNGKWGIISIDGNVIIPNIYDEIYNFDFKKTNRMEGPYINFFDYVGKTAAVKKNGKWGLVNIKGEEITDFIYEEFFIPDVQLFYEDRVAAKKNGLWGFLNEKGKPISPFIYEEVGSTFIKYPRFISTFSEGIALVKKDGKWGAVDLDSHETIPFIYDYISIFNEELKIVKKDGKWGFVDNKGLEIIPANYDEIKWFEMGLCPAKKDGEWGFLNEKGEVVIPTMYEDIIISEEVSYEGGLWFFSQDGYCGVKKNGKWGLIDKDNNIKVNFEYDDINFTSDGLDDWRFISDGFLAVQKGKFWSVVNRNGLNHIPFEYDDVQIWSEGKVCVKKNGKWGLLDSLGSQLVPIEHESAMEAGNFRYKTNHK